VTVRRDEVESKISSASVRSAMSQGSGSLGLCIEDDRQQRTGLFLKEVHYRIHAHFDLTGKAGAEDNRAKFADMFSCRARKGQCINQPYFGCREFSCDFAFVENG
jgi:CRISPR-associated protein Cas5d